MKMALKYLPETVAGRRLTDNVRGSLSEDICFFFALEQISRARAIRAI